MDNEYWLSFKRKLLKLTTGIFGALLVDCNEDKNEFTFRGLQLSSGFTKVPSVEKEDFYHKTTENWLKTVRDTSDIGPYWRVHNKLYDLTDFMDRHPGGKFWLETTKGVDITEAFVSHHINDIADITLEKYFVKDIHTPRFSPFTFKDEGFYMTLKRKARIALKGVKNCPSTQMKMIQDGLFVAFLSTLLFGCLIPSYTVVILAGIFLTLSTNCAHNFLHQKNNWRMYIFDFSLFSTQEWRVLHSLSHHLYTNTINDFELHLYRPFFEPFPISEKGLVQRYPYMHPNSFFFFSFLVDYIKRILHVLDGSKKFDYPVLIQPLLYIAMVLATKSFMTSILLWIVLHFTFTFVYLLISFPSGHFSMYAYMEGDYAIEDRDWGMHQIVAIAERKETLDYLPYSSVTNGSHTLHHLFPAVDQSKLPLLLGSLLETCQEFNVDFKVFSTWDACMSMFYRFYATTPIDIPIKIRFKNSRIRNGPTFS